MKHGLKHGQKVGPFVADTKSDEKWVILHDAEGKPKVRQAKTPVKMFMQGGTNPDYTGFLAYRLEYFADDRWKVYDNSARAGDIRKQLRFMTEDNHDH